MSNQNAKRDDNQVPAKLGVLKTDGVSTVRILGTSGAVNVSFVSGGSNTVATEARKDDNEVNSMLVTSYIDATPMSVAADSSGNILFKLV